MELPDKDPILSAQQGDERQRERDDDLSQVWKRVFLVWGKSEMG